MFATQYYCLVASLKEYALDADTKGFDARAIGSGILEEVNRGDSREVRLLYGYYDCENIACLLYTSWHSASITSPLNP